MNSDLQAGVLPPVIYHLGLVVDSADESRRFFSEMWGIGPWEVLDYVPTKEELMIGEPYALKVAAAKMPPAAIELLQPVSGESIYSRFLEDRGEGLHHLAFSVPNWDEMSSRVIDCGGNMIAGGIGVGRRWGYFQTGPGGLIIEFEEQLDGKPVFSPAENYGLAVPPIQHISLIVKDLYEAKEFLSRSFNLGPWQVLEQSLERDQLMVGGPCQLRLAWTNLGPLVLELIEPLEGESIWSDFLKTAGEGLHHLAFSVPNWDEVVGRARTYGGRMIAGATQDGKRWCYLAFKPSGLVVEIFEGELESYS